MRPFSKPLYLKSTYHLYLLTKYCYNYDRKFVLHIYDKLKWMPSVQQNKQLFRNISIFILLNVNITCTLRTSTALVKLYIIPSVTPEARVWVAVQ